MSVKWEERLGPRVILVRYDKEVQGMVKENLNENPKSLSENPTQRK